MERNELIAQNSSDEISRRRDLLIREWCVVFCTKNKEDVNVHLPVWRIAFSDIDPILLASLFKRALQTVKWFPQPSEILAPMQAAKQAIEPQEAEDAWQKVLDIRRLHYNPDIPQYLANALAALPERVQQAARASGIFREVSDLEQIYTWGRKKFIESYLRSGALAENSFALPEGELKNLLAEAAQRLALPIPKQSYGNPDDEQ